MNNIHKEKISEQEGYGLKKSIVEAAARKHSLKQIFLKSRQNARKRHLERFHF